MTANPHGSSPTARRPGLWLGLPLAAAALTLTACHSDTSAAPGSLSRTARANAEDTRILSILSHKDDEEVRIGRLAQRRAQSDEARDLANMLVADHGKHGTEVADLASRLGITLWNHDQFRQDQQRAKGEPPKDPIAMLDGVEAARFDREFGKAMLDGHSDLIATLEQAKPLDPSVRALVDRTLPTLRRHADAARALASR